MMKKQQHQNQKPIRKKIRNQQMEKIIKRRNRQPSRSLHYLSKVISTGCHLVHFCFLVVAILLTSN